MKSSLPGFLLCLSVALPLVAGAADTMLAAVISAPGAAQIQTITKPEPQPGQVRIKAASVNPVDWKIADRAPPGSHLIAGRDLSGVIDAAGASAGPWKAGDAVIAIATGGSYAEYALASKNAVAAKPTRMSFEEAAGIPVVGERAWRSMVTLCGRTDSLRGSGAGERRNVGIAELANSGKFRINIEQRCSAPVCGAEPAGLEEIRLHEELL
jgi:D-arabinose 1-dehydrogenase-like Zn-dependent alcohol dehydrogenase